MVVFRPNKYFSANAVINKIINDVVDDTPQEVITWTDNQNFNYFHNENDNELSIEMNATSNFAGTIEYSFKSTEASTRLVLFTNNIDQAAGYTLIFDATGQPTRSTAIHGLTLSSGFTDGQNTIYFQSWLDYFGTHWLCRICFTKNLL